MHGGERKDVELTFGALKKQWAILATLAREYIKDKLANIMYTCIILHNIFIKDCKEAICPKWYPDEAQQSDDLIRSDEQKYRIISDSSNGESAYDINVDNMKIDNIDYNDAVDEVNDVDGVNVSANDHDRVEDWDASVNALDLDIDDVCGQGYDNGSNMKGKHQKDNDFVIQSQAKFLATNELGVFEFIVAIVIWFDILQRSHRVFYAIDVAKQIAIEMDINPLFIKMRVIRRKRKFDEASVEQDVILSVEESFKLYNNNRLKSCCSPLEAALKNGDRYDIDANELYVELRSLDNYLPTENMRPLDVLNFLKQDDRYHNAIIAYRVLLIIPVTVAYAERSFSKIKLLKSHLRSIMSQERLNGLALIVIENDILESVNYDDLIKNFAFKNARRIALF
ncbi:zinc finger MYM-type protein 1 [Tanacetum coccineum]